MQGIKIAISGELGSGKTVLSRKLHEALGYELISIGKVMRQLAKEYGMNTLEFNKYIENHPEIDKECDNRIAGYGQNEVPLILDSRLAWHFIPHSFKVHLIVSPDIASKRIFSDEHRKDETYINLTEAMQKLAQRKESEIIRFKQQYIVDIQDFDNYHLVVDTSYATPDEIFALVMDMLEKWKQKQVFTKLWMAPRNVFPTRKFSEIKDNPEAQNQWVELVKQGSHFYVYQGHELISQALLHHQNFIPARLIDLKKLPEDFANKIIHKGYFLQESIKIWERMHGFTFGSYPRS